MATWSYTETDKGQTLLVSGEVTRVIPSANPNFQAALAYCRTEGPNIDLNYVLDLVEGDLNKLNTVGNKLVQLSERVSYKKGKLRFDGDKVEGPLVDHIVRMVEADEEDYSPFVLFLENLALNPSKQSRKFLFEYVQARNFTITEDGCFIAYKGVTKDHLSLHSGKAIVDGVEITGFIPNEVGSTVEMPRKKVDDNREVACSDGLHAGTRRYASSYGNVMLAVSINPRDVVMVPSDGNGEKLRVCRYTVLEINDAEYTQPVLRKEAVEDDSQDEEIFYCISGCDTEVGEDGDQCDDCFNDESGVCDECAECMDYGCKCG